MPRIALRRVPKQAELCLQPCLAAFVHLIELPPRDLARASVGVFLLLSRRPLLIVVVQRCLLPLDAAAVVASGGTRLRPPPRLLLHDPIVLIKLLAVQPSVLSAQVLTVRVVERLGAECAVLIISRLVPTLASLTGTPTAHRHAKAASATCAALARR